MVNKRDKRPFSGMAIAGFVLSFFGIISILGIIFSSVGLAQTGEGKNKKRGRGLAIAGLVISIIMTLWSFVALDEISLDMQEELSSLEEDFKSDASYISSDNEDSIVEDNLNVATIGDVFCYAENWDSDSRIDGIEFFLFPKNYDGRAIKAAGKVNVKVWEQECVEYSEYIKTCMKYRCTKRESLIAAEGSVEINSSDYNYKGARIRVEYRKGYVPNDDLGKDKGCAEIKFIDYKNDSFNAFDELIFLNG